MEKKVYQALAIAITARKNCEKMGNEVWYDNHSKTIKDIIDGGPSGSGIDCGTKIDLAKSHGEKIVLSAEYHHMNENGYYDSWTYHNITVVPSLQFGFLLKIGGRNRNDIKEYLHEIYACWLNELVAFN